MSSVKANPPIMLRLGDKNIDLRRDIDKKDLEEGIKQTGRYSFLDEKRDVNEVKIKQCEVRDRAYRDLEQKLHSLATIVDLTKQNVFANKMLRALDSASEQHVKVVVANDTAADSLSLQVKSLAEEGVWHTRPLANPNNAVQAANSRGSN